MLKTVALSPNALIDEETARDFLKDPPPDHYPRVAEAVNRATAEMESRCRRHLLSRSATLDVDGTGFRWVYLPDFPVTAVTSAKFRQADSTYADLTVTGWQTDSAGVLLLPDDFFPFGILNIRVAGTFGFKSGTHDDELRELRGWCAELTEIFYRQWLDAPGRAASVAAGPAAKAYPNLALPAHIEAGLGRYARVM